MPIPLPIRIARSGWAFSYFAMPKRRYKKPFLHYSELIQQLKKRGLIINNEEKALHLLKNISYYRFSGYWFPLLEDKLHHRFKPGASFDTAFNLYCFDRELRLLILREIEKIEVAVRSQMNHMLAKYRGVFWYNEVSIFKNIKTHRESLIKLKKDYKRSDEKFVKSFSKKYIDKFPPCWIMLEITSFGSLSIMFENLKPGRTKRDIANYFGLDDGTMSSWLHSLVYLRNVCAHHNRLWNRVMGITPKNPRNPNNLWLKNNNRADKTYFVLSMIIYLLNTVNPNHTFKNRINSLLKNYPNVDVRAMGFPNNWESEKLWN